MKSILVESTYFNIKDTLECGQIFRYTPFKEGYLVFSGEKCTYVYTKNDKTIIECDENDEKYFYDYFDLDKEYSKIVERAKAFNFQILSKSAELGKGIRILKQNSIEMLFSFMISQNNNIPRIRKIIDRLCTELGEKKQFLGMEYFAFPTPTKMAKMPLEFYKQIGLGYRAEYVLELAKTIENGLKVNEYNQLKTEELKRELLKIKGIGEKVANCVLLFGFNRSDSFPVDTWIEKVYREDFFGKEKDINKITKYFLSLFNKDAGYIQQYLFYYKRSLENK